VKQILNVANAGDLAHRTFDPVDLIPVLKRPAQDDDAAVGVDADPSLRDGPVAEQLALHLAYEADIVELRRMLAAVGNRVHEPDDLARFVMRLALEPPSATTSRAHAAVAQEPPPPLAAARVQEELEHRTTGERRYGRGKAAGPKRARACPPAAGAPAEKVAPADAPHPCDRHTRSQRTPLRSEVFEELTHPTLLPDRIAAWDVKLARSQARSQAHREIAFKLPGSVGQAVPFAVSASPNVVLIVPAGSAATLRCPAGGNNAAAGDRSDDVRQSRSTQTSATRRAIRHCDQLVLLNSSPPPD
jgi:hypothetical protein